MISETGVRLNDLPVDLALRIISLIPTEFAVVTSGLCTKWRDYRKQVDYLGFLFEDSRFDNKPNGRR